MRKGIGIVFGVLLYVGFSAPLIAYESIPFRNGGTIEGVVEYAGPTVPQDPELTLTTETEYCGQHLPAGEYLIRDRKIQNVVVYLVGIQNGKPLPRETVTVTNKKCQFEPHVSVAFKGGKLGMKTDDPILHTFDVHASMSGKEVYHLTLHQQGSTVVKKLPGAGLLDLSCYIHPWQHAFVYVFEQPYATITDEAGKFIIRDIPPGTYAVEAWHEGLGVQRLQAVKVESGKTSAVTLKYAGER